MKTLTLAFGISLAIAGHTAVAETHEHDMSQHQMQMDKKETRVHAIGELKAINAQTGKVQIAHEAIAELGWPPMTMWFLSTAVLPPNIHIGDAVTFEMMPGKKNDYVIVKINKK
jgi:Cu(I)/Ag(I) efflux system protein CusF